MVSYNNKVDIFSFFSFPTQIKFQESERQVSEIKHRGKILLIYIFGIDNNNKHDKESIKKVNNTNHAYNKHIYILNAGSFSLEVLAVT